MHSWQRCISAEQEAPRTDRTLLHLSTGLLRPAASPIVLLIVLPATAAPNFAEGVSVVSVGGSSLVSGESGPFFAESPPTSPDSPSPIANLDCRWCCPGPPSSPGSRRRLSTQCSCSSVGAAVVQERCRPRPQIHPDQTRPDQTRPDPTRPEQGIWGGEKPTDTQTHSHTHTHITHPPTHNTRHSRVAPGRQGGSFEFGRQALQFSAGVQPTNDTCSMQVMRPCCLFPTDGATPIGFS